MNSGAIRIVAFVFAGVAMLAVTSGADAADPAGSWRKLPPVEDAPAPRYQELLSGWYLRGDFSYRFDGVGSVTGSPSAVSTKYNNAIGGTFGFGYKYQWFRTDLTIDRNVPSKLSAITATGTQPQFSAKVGSITALANIYFDMGTWWGFTPYVGGGVGVAEVKSSSFSDTAHPQGVMSSNGTIVNMPGQAINFSYALMAGVAYQVAPNWMVDIGYRYLSMGNVESVDGAGTSNSAPVFKNLTSQEARIGIRFLFD